MKAKLPIVFLSALLLSACSNSTSENQPIVNETTSQETADDTTDKTTQKEESTTSQTTEEKADGELFTERDLKQTADLSSATTLALADNQQSVIDSEGVYVLSGTYQNSTVVVEAGDDDKVQLVLDGLNITNDNFPAIYVKNADKLFVTTTDSENTLSVTGTFVADGDTNTDSVIFSRDDVVLNGTGTLNISSSDNGISSKDDVKITGGTINIASTSDGIEANERILVNDGVININSYKDGFNAGNSDDTAGSVTILGGTFNLNCSDDGIQATTTLQIDGGTFTINAAEGLEATQMTINGGSIDITASDDGINAAQKTSGVRPSITINDGNITIVMGAGDTDGIDSNGDLFINGGTIDITARSPFDYDGTGQKNGGTIIVNGQQTDQLQNQMMGGGMRGGRA